MKILNRYIQKTIILSTLFIVFVLMGLQLFISFFQELSDLGKGSYTFLVLMQYVFLTLPGNVYQFFPMAGLIGSLVGLGCLASNHELVVMRTSGVSIFRILFSVMKAAIIMIIFAVIVGEIAGRYFNGVAENLKANAQMQGDAINTMNGVWLHQQNRFIHIDKAESMDHLLGVTQYTIAPDHRIMEISYAKSATKTGDAWQLNDVTGTQFGDDKKTVSFFAQWQPWSVQFQPQLVRLLQADPDNLSLRKVHELIQYRLKNNLSTADLSLSFWQRIIQPFSTLVLIFLGAPIIFGPLRKVSMGVRLLIGISIGFLFFLANRFLGPISIYYQISPLIGASLPMIVFLIFGAWMISRVK